MIYDRNKFMVCGPDIGICWEIRYAECRNKGGKMIGGNVT